MSVNNLGSFITILSPDRQWKTDVVTDGVGRLYSLIGLADMSDSTGGGSTPPVIPDVSLVIVFNTPTDYITNNSGGSTGSQKLGNTAFDAGLRIPFVGADGQNRSISLLNGYYNTRFKNIMASEYVENVDFPIYIVDTDGNAVNLTAYSTRTITFNTPHGDLITVTPSYITDGTDGGMYYNVGGGQFAINGKWTFRVRLDSWYSNFYKFNIRGK